MNRNQHLRPGIFPEWGFSPQKSPIVKTGSWETTRQRLRNLLTIFTTGYRAFGSMRQTIDAMRELERLRRAVWGNFPIKKVAKVDGRYFWGLSAPGLPSKTCHQYYRRILDFVHPERKSRGLRIVYQSITNKCPLQCEHCYEWERLNQGKPLSTEDQILIVSKLQQLGTDVFYLEGGEPLVRFDHLLKILKAAKDTSDFWIVTSGYRLTPEKALLLKQNGLTGILVSLDHYRKQVHNQFRGSDHAFQWAINAVVHANQAGLVTALSVCTTREFITSQNLSAYMELARRLGVSFVQLLEPRAVGRYSGKDVMITREQQRRLTSFYLQYNREHKYATYPILFYPAYHQRQLGCFGAGKQYLYVDVEGFVHACPFCQEKAAHLFHFSVEEAINQLRARGCHMYAPNSVKSAPK